MANEKRLIDANELKRLVLAFATSIKRNFLSIEAIIDRIDVTPTVDAVEVADKELLEAIKMLVKQYEHSKQSDYVHSPVAHALYHTWKQVDESGYGERRTDNERKAD